MKQLMRNMNSKPLVRLFAVITLVMVAKPANAVANNLLSVKLTEEARQMIGWMRQHTVLDLGERANDQVFAPKMEAANADEYWARLKVLGEMIDPETGARLLTATDLSREEVVASLARQYSEHLQTVEEIGALYGVPAEKLDTGVLNRYFPNANTNSPAFGKGVGGFASRVRGLPMQLHPKHAAPAFRHSWEAWLLSPYCEKRRVMRQHVFDSLSAGGGNQQTATVGLLWLQSVSESAWSAEWKRQFAHPLLHAIQRWGTADQVVVWSLQWLTEAEKGGFVTSPDGNKERDYYDVLYNILTWPGENNSESRYKFYVEAVRKCDISKLPPSHQRLLKRVLATYATYEHK